jgi:hypothetical protein
MGTERLAVLGAKLTRHDGGEWHSGKTLLGRVAVWPASADVLATVYLWPHGTRRVCLTIAEADDVDTVVRRADDTLRALVLAAKRAEVPGE